MKKLGLLATLAMCVTIGGVYAAWNYADTTTFVDRETVSIGLTAAGSVTGESLEITHNSLKFLIDDTNGDKKGDTVVAEGEITVTYTAVANNFETVNIYCNVEIDGTYFTTTLSANELTQTFDLQQNYDEPDEPSNYIAGQGGTLVWTIPASAFEITTNPESIVSLPTKQDYDNFSISGNQIRVEFTTAPRA